MSQLEENFILQQGYAEPAAASCSPRYGALQFQPRVVASLFMVGILTQSGAVFLMLSALLWVGALFPDLNPFEAIYNRIFAHRPKGQPISAAPPPRRFAQGMAATFTLAIGVCVYFQQRLPAYILEGIMVIALVALTFGGFCLGSFIFHLIQGRLRFALDTLPWKKA